MKYVHGVHYVRGSHGPAGLCTALDHLSGEGWELISLERIMVPTGSQLVVPGQQNVPGEPGWEVVMRRLVDAQPCTCKEEND